jgi:hypothetical protein
LDALALVTNKKQKKYSQEGTLENNISSPPIARAGVANPAKEPYPSSYLDAQHQLTRLTNNAQQLNFSQAASYPDITAII